ncbi:hypothetical protein Tco_0096923 [Tanacetum coccineum]
MSNLKFVETHNLVAFLEKPKESDGFEGIIDFLNASSIRYALTVNPTIYTSCIKQFWAIAKEKTVNREVQIQALVDRKMVIITETSVRRALQLKDAEVLRLLLGTNLVALWPLLSSVLPQTKNSTFPNKQVEGMTKHKEVYVTPSHTKKVFATMKREGKGFSGRVTHLFETMMVQAPEELGEGSELLNNPQHTPTIIQPSTSQPQNKQPRRKQRKDTKVPQPSGSTEPITDEAANEEHVHVHSNDPLLSEITKLKESVKKLERRNKSRTPELKRLRKVGRTARIESSEDEEVTLVDEAQEKNDDNLMFDTGVFDVEEVEVEKVVSTAEVTTASATTTTAKDKGKGKMIEPKKPLKKKDKILVDEEIAQRLQEELQAELEEEEMLARQKEEVDNLIS